MLLACLAWRSSSMQPRTCSGLTCTAIDAHDTETYRDYTAWSYRTTVVVAFAYAFAFAVVVVVEFAWPNRLDAVVEIADDDGYDYHSSVGFQHRIGSIDCSIVCLLAWSAVAVDCQAQAEPWTS